MPSLAQSLFSLPKSSVVGSIPLGVQLQNLSFYKDREIHVLQKGVFALARDIQVYAFNDILSDPLLTCWHKSYVFEASYADVITWGKPGFVYMVQAVGSIRYKIGFSNDPLRRLNQLKGQQPAQSPFDIRIIAVSPLVFDMNKYESSWHKMLCEFRVRGEWFDMPDDLAKTVARTISEGGKPVLGVDQKTASLTWDEFTRLADWVIVNQIEDRKKIREWNQEECFF